MTDLAKLVARCDGNSFDLYLAVRRRMPAGSYEDFLAAIGDPKTLSMRICSNGQYLKKKKSITCSKPYAQIEIL
jgi:hypothetical protein